VSLNLYSWSAASSVSTRISQWTVSLNLYSWSAASSISTRVSQRTQCLSTYTLHQLLLRSQRVSHSEHSVSQPILMLSCFFHLNAHPTAHTVFLQPVLTLNCFFGLNAFLTAHTISTYRATMATRMASLLSKAIGVTHPLTQAPTQSLTQENYDYMAGVSACRSLCCGILWT
jgi:hypothetical protein